MKSDIEEALLLKYASKPALPIIITEEELPELIPRQALVDNILMENKKYDKSLAHKKRLWVGENATFTNKDLQEYYKVYN